MPVKVQTKTIETSTAVITLVDGDIVKLRFKPDVSLELSHLTENRKASAEISGSKKYYVLSIPARDTTMTPEFREKFSDNEAAKSKIAEAVVVSELHQIILARHVKSQSPNYPYNFFKTEEEALDWLKSIKKKTGRG